MAKEQGRSTRSKKSSKYFCHSLAFKCFIHNLLSLSLFVIYLNIPHQTQDELEKVAREICDLHETLRVKDSALKLAETRLENRTNRFN